jgi:hypothetical protein
LKDRQKQLDVGRWTEAQRDQQNQGGLDALFMITGAFAYLISFPESSMGYHEQWISKQHTN